MTHILDSIYNFIIAFLFPKKEILQGIEHMSVSELQSLEKDFGPHPFLTFPTYSLFQYRHPLIKAAIHEIKYNNNQKIALLFSEVLKISLIRIFSTQTFGDFIIIPLPSHHQKYRKKGFNQNETILYRLQQHSSLNVQYILIKTKATLDQTHLHKKKRLENIQDVFSVRLNIKYDLLSTHIILFDDVVTTGATLYDAYKTLVKAGVPKEHISALTLAH